MIDAATVWLAASDGAWLTFTCNAGDGYSGGFNVILHFVPRGRRASSCGKANGANAEYVEPAEVKQRACKPLTCRSCIKRFA